MATITSPGAGWMSATNAITYTSGSFTPVANDLLVLLVEIEDETSTDWAPSDSLGGSWVKPGTRIIKDSSTDFAECWIRTTLAAASAMTVTFSHASGNAAGSAARILRISGMTKTGSAAFRQDARQDNGAAASAPSVTFSVAVDTNNPTFAVAWNNTNPFGGTAPSGWTEVIDTGHNTPATGIHGCTRNSGFSGTTVTWGANSASVFCAMCIEFDASVPGARVIQREEEDHLILPFEAEFDPTGWGRG